MIAAEQFRPRGSPQSAPRPRRLSGVTSTESANVPLFQTFDTHGFKLVAAGRQRPSRA